MPVYENATPRDEQEYVTDDALAALVVDLAAQHAPSRCTYVDIGVGTQPGTGLYHRLPHPRRGVELQPQAAEPQAAEPHDGGVTYGTDARTWTPDVPPSHPNVCVVCNPPFLHQAALFNRAAQHFAPSGELVVVWIVGLSMRLWTNENRLDPHMHLVAEWLVPPSLATFAVQRRPDRKRVHIKTAIQVWVRRPLAPPRALWTFPARLDGFAPAYAEPLPDGCVVLSRTCNSTQLGKVGVLGRTAHRDADRHYALNGDGLAEHDPGATATLGTLRRGHGTSLVLRPTTATAADVDAVRRRVLQLRQRGAFRDLYATRTSLTIAALTVPVLAHLMTHEPETLARPIAYVDGVVRQERQW